MECNPLRLHTALLWMAGYFGVMLGYTALDVALWRRLAPRMAPWLDALATAACSAAFLIFLHARTGRPSRWMEGVTVSGAALAALCAIGFYLVLDRGLDPILAKRFPGSEGAYQEAVRALSRSPAASFWKVCVIAPVMEEALTRGFLLDGLRWGYGAAAALLISAAVFALLHFNLAQGLSALVCGVVLGLLYLRTGSLACCVLAHFSYNAISYAAVLRGIS